MRRQNELKLRSATLEDAHDLWLWRNDPVTRANSFHGQKISLREHTRWLQKSLRSRRRRIYIATRKGERAGTIRFDFLPPKVIQISINLSPEFRGKGYGKLILKKASDLMIKKYPDHFQKALIKKGNQKSEKVFTSAGFLKIHETEEGYSVWIRNSH